MQQTGHAKLSVPPAIQASSRHHIITQRHHHFRQILPKDEKTNDERRTPQSAVITDQFTTYLLPQHQQQSSFLRDGELPQLIRSSLGSTFLPPSPSSTHDLLQGRAFLSSSGTAHHQRQIIDDPRKPYFVCKIFNKETAYAKIDLVIASDTLCALLDYSKVRMLEE